MDNIKKLNKEAWKEITQLHPSMWSMLAYSTHIHYDLQVNNMCEGFSKVILEYRDNPIISLVKRLKLYMTNGIVMLRDFMLRHEGIICPIIIKRLEK